VDWFTANELLPGLALAVVQGSSPDDARMAASLIET
jgi:hypothetical protein